MALVGALEIERFSGLCRLIGSEYDLVGAQRVPQTGQGHVLTSSERTEEGLELVQIGMIGDIARIEHFHGKLAPAMSVALSEMVGMEFIVKQAAFAADKVGVEIVGLKT